MARILAPGNAYVDRNSSLRSIVVPPARLPTVRLDHPRRVWPMPTMSPKDLSMTKPLLSLDSGALGFLFVSADAAHAWAIGPAAAALRVKAMAARSSSCLAMPSWPRSACRTPSNPKLEILGSQIADPPLTAPGFHTREPDAGGIQGNNGRDPEQVGPT